MTQRGHLLPGLALAALAAWAGPALAVPTSSFTVAGTVDWSATLALSDMPALPAQTASVTFGTGAT